MELQPQTKESAIRTHKGTMFLLYVLTTFCVAFIINGLIDVYDLVTSVKTPILGLAFIATSVLTFIWVINSIVNQAFRFAIDKHQETLNKMNTKLS